ncbi:integral peroxisomal membrane peroxin-domain-containing protein [Nemania sp. FL0916]|nr:integral peroxisomal membrane peroxin-domain-containing protein [Nemania sp. FL0916]
MDDYNTESFVNRDDPIPTIILNNPSPRPETPTPTASEKRGAGHDSSQSDTETPSRSSGGGGIRSRFSALKEKARIQDHLIEKLLSQVVPLDDAEMPKDSSGLPGRTSKPNFTLATMSNNFRRFNSRIGVVFVFQARVIRLLAWRRPTQTMSFLAVYTFVCLDPSLLPLLPLAILLVAVLVPSFVARHPAAEFNLTHEQAISYAAYGPPLAPAVTVKPVKELSRDFFHNMRDLQNSMEDFSQMHDAVVRLVVPRTNFSNEAQSSALFVVLFAACLFMSIAANLLPWRLIFLLAGWAATCAGHPMVQKQLETAHKKHVQPQEEKAKQAATRVEKWIERDVILDSAPETREVEIFELQRLSSHTSSGEWEPWLFSASPYDPLSPQRIAGDRPTGTRFFEDVRPPQGWAWSEKKWALDLWSREWVEERIITSVEIETEGERWVYDIYDEKNDYNKIGVVIDGSTFSSNNDNNNNTNNKVKTAVDDGAVPTSTSTPTPKRPKPSWEEGEDGDGRRGDWRRRRWVRLVKRKFVSRDALP